MDPARTRGLVEAAWRDSIVPAITDYIRIPCQSPAFDPAWAEHGHLEQAVRLARDWVESRELARATIDILRLPGRTPVLLIEVEGSRPGTVLMYGHLDKQPPFAGWREGLGPWTPVREGDRLYGRGAADDGYAVFAATAAIQALQAQGSALPRIVVLIECSEESGSPDLPAHLDAAAERIGTPDFVVCLDSGCGDYERLWATTSLRGMVIGDLSVDILREGVHSGDASGIVPSSFRILRILLDRLEDARTGRLVPAGLHVDIPPARIAAAKSAAAVLGDQAWSRFPWMPGAGPASTDVPELLLDRTWRPTLSYTAQAGLPALDAGGNVLRPSTTLKLSFRIPPTLDSAAAAALIQRTLEADPPHGARVRFTATGSDGWNAPATAPWLDEAMSAASRAHFGGEPSGMGEGGSIPFMAMLGQRFPGTQFLITGVLGPESNAHGPNEFLHVPTAVRLTACVADIVARMP